MMMINYDDNDDNIHNIPTDKKREKKIAKVINTRTKDKQNTHTRKLSIQEHTYLQKHTHTR